MGGKEWEGIRSLTCEEVDNKVTMKDGGWLVLILPTQLRVMQSSLYSFKLPFGNILYTPRILPDHCIEMRERGRQRG